MTQRAPRRYRTAGGTARRRARVRRASAGLTPIRSAAILAMLLAGGAMYGLAATPAFGFRELTISGNALIPESEVRGAVSLAPGTNLVGLDTGPIAGRVAALAAVDAVEITVGLPGTLAVQLRERRPIVIWAIGERRIGVDEDGLLFADVGTAATGPRVGGIPVVRDDRAGSAGLAIRARLDPIDLDAATRLGSLTPSQIGSRASKLAVRISDDRGFTVGSGSDGWLAVFGFYGRSQRTPDLIPGQVQLLAALLAGREDAVQTVILADDRDGTWVPKPTSRPTPTSKPSKSP
ncbi:MAG TPA: FtsQ-type POTRA domain-containing protein [Patescibacteria group bacterium]|nr:FtsQ-type POTRA domain-containing protein [Patescibacteria group bacterium]